MLDALEQQLPDRRRELSRDPTSVLEQWADVEFRRVPEISSATGCSVAGNYYGQLTPPIIAVADALSAGRRAFTALHELGHHLQQSNLALAEAVDRHGADAVRFEDAACDAFAAELLVPDATVTAYLSAHGPTATDIAALHRATAASRAAVCVRAAQRLTAPGHIVLLDADGIVQFAAAHLVPRLPRDSDQSGATVVRDALSRDSHRARGRARFTYRDGITGDEFYADAAPVRGYIVVVAVTERPPWETVFTLPIAATGPTGGSWVCGHAECGEEFTTFDRPCPRCHAPACPACGRCACEPRVKTRVCGGCFLEHPQTYFDGDRCQDCA